MHLNYSTRTKGGKTYRYYSLAESYRDENKVPRKRVIKSLGKLTSEEVDKWKVLLAVTTGKTEVTSLLDPSKLEFTDSKKYLDVAILSEVFDNLNFCEPFKLVNDSDKDISLEQIAKILIISRCLDPGAKYKTVDWFNDSYLPKLLNIQPNLYNKNKLFRTLSSIHSRKKYLQDHLIKFASSISDNSKRLYFFDGTTSFFEGTSVEMATGGKDKTHGYQNKIILICLLTDQNGLPLAWDVLPGNKKDVTEFKEIANKLMKEAKITDITFCFDRGVASIANFSFIENTLKSKFISGLNRDQIDPVFKLKDFLQIRQLLIEEYDKLAVDPANAKRRTSVKGFTRLGKDRFYRDLGVINKRRYVVSFNANIFHREQSDRDNSVEIVKQKIDDLNTKLELAKRDRNDIVLEEKITSLIKKHKLQKIINYTILPCSSKNKNIQTYKVSYNIDDKELALAGEGDGILVYISNHTEQKSDNNLYEVPASQIVQHYKDKYVIEDCFRSLKTFGDLRPFFVRKQEHIKAHVDICMCSYFINRYIYLKLRSTGVSLSTFYSTVKKYSRVCELKEGRTKKVFLRSITKELREIINNLGVKTVINKRRLKELDIISN